MIDGLVPASAGLAVSATEIVCVPGVWNVAVNVPVPLVSPVSAGRVAAASVLVKWTVPG